jgi:hypothetical protein
VEQLGGHKPPHHQGHGKEQLRGEGPVGVDVEWNLPKAAVVQPEPRNAQVVRVRIPGNRGVEGEQEQGHHHNSQHRSPGPLGRQRCRAPASGTRRSLPAPRCPGKTASAGSPRHEEWPQGQGPQARQEKQQEHPVGRSQANGAQPSKAVSQPPPSKGPLQPPAPGHHGCHHRPSAQQVQ